MYKALTFTALAGTAVAAPWSYDVFPLRSVKNSDNTFNYLTLSFTVSFDTGYTTAFNPKNGGMVE